MTWWQALILGIVEGLTEYLPVSSTGHLILVNWLLGFYENPNLEAAANTYSIVIQAGAILAVLGLYWRRIVSMGKGIMGRDEAGKRLAINLLMAFLPAAILGPLLNDTIKANLFQPLPVVGALFVGAWLMLAVAFSRKLSGSEHKGMDMNAITIPIALMIGFGQCIAMWPGTSRSMMTIVAGLMLGLRPRAAAEFSFLLGLITLSAATGYDAYRGGAQMLDTFGPVAITIGLLASAVSAAIAVKWFVAFLTKHGLAPFGWYRLALAMVFAGLIYTGVAEISATPDVQPEPLPAVKQP